PADPEPYLSRYRRYPARAQAEKPRSLRPALPPVAQPVAGPRLLVRRKGSQGRRPLFPRARALARSAGATRGTRGDPRASARLRGRDQGAALRVARGARLRAAPLADQRGARPRLHRSAHQAQEHPRARRPDYGQSEGDGPARRPRRRDQGRDRRDSERNAPHIRSPLTAKGLMPPKRKKTAAKPRVLQPLPQNTCWIESDAYDRRVFGTLRAEAPSLRSIEETGSTFLPHFDSLLQDIFCVLFKNNVVVQAEREMPPSARFNRIFLSALRQGELYAILREMTTLNEAKAGLCTLLLGESLIALLKAEKLLTRREMLDLWDIQKQEEIFTEKQNEFTEAEKLTAEQADKEIGKLLERAKDKLEGEMDGAEALLRQKAQRLQEELGQKESDVGRRFQAEAIKAAENLEDAAEQAEEWGSGLGSGYRSPPGQKLELGKRLAGNEKLKKLSRMIGRMKFNALALRKKIFERASEEVLEVERG